MKVIWIGDAVMQSGFSTVTHGICDELQSKCNLSVFGISYNGKIRNTFGYYVFPGASHGDLYSFAYASELVFNENPEVVVLFNDLPVILEYANQIRRFLPKIPIVALFPVNIPPVSSKEIIGLANNDISEIMTYTEAAKKHILSINPNLSVSAIYHGVNRKIYCRDEQCKQLTGLEDSFVVGYVGSNTQRKRLDLLIEGFAKFAHNKSDVRCVLHTNDPNSVYPLVDVADYFKVKDKLILSSGNVVSDRIKLIYSIMDVNINTSLGEGFGLPLLEGASCGVPILCPEHSNLTDIWSSGADFIKICRHEYIPGTNQVGAVIDTNDMADKLNRMYEDRNYLKQQSTDALVRSQNTMFAWNTVADKVYNVLLSASKSRVSIIV